MSTQAAIATVEEVVPLAQAAGIKTSVTMSASFGCPYEGEVPIGRVADIAGRLAATGSAKSPWQTRLGLPFHATCCGASPP